MMMPIRSDPMASEKGPEPDPRPMHERDPLNRFSNRADDYVRYRPDYPAAAFSAMLDGLGDPASLTAVDVGAGTGIATRQLAALGPRVIAVEPNAAMREQAGPHLGITWVAGSAEATTLPARSADLVLAAQAFHWFNQDVALREFHRILRPRGRLALMWNDDDPDDPVMHGYRAAVLKAAARDWPASNPFTADDLEASGPYVRARALQFSHGQRLDEPGLLGRARSASYVPRDGPRFDELVRDLRAIFQRHADSSGTVRLGYRTQLYLADPAPPPPGTPA
jgi:SAM-dependent methyltransferase